MVNIVQAPGDRLNVAMPSTANIITDSPYCNMMRGEGRCLVNSGVTFTATGTPVQTNIFSFSYPFRLVRLLAYFTDVTDIADMDDVGFDVYDGTNQADLTLHNAGGATLDGYSNYSLVAKVAAAASAVTALNSDQIRVDETAPIKTFSTTLVVPKNGVTNYIRFVYDSAQINVTMTFVIVYEDLSSAIPSGLAVV